MLPDPILPTPEDDIARILEDYGKRLSHLERLEGGGLGLGARVFNSADIAVPTAANTPLTFDTERFDNDNIHSTVINTGRLTAQTAGIYVIAGSIKWASSGVGQRQINILLNGALYISRILWRFTAAGTMYMSISTIYEMAVGDFVLLDVFQSSGGNLNIVSEGNTSPEFSMVKVG